MLVYLYPSRTVGVTLARRRYAPNRPSWFCLVALCGTVASPINLFGCRPHLQFLSGLRTLGIWGWAMFFGGTLISGYILRTGTQQFSTAFLMHLYGIEEIHRSPVNITSYGRCGCKHPESGPVCHNA